MEFTEYGETLAPRSGPNSGAGGQVVGVIGLQDEELLLDAVGFLEASGHKSAKDPGCWSRVVLRYQPCQCEYCAFKNGIS